MTPNVGFVSLPALERRVIIQGWLSEEAIQNDKEN